MNITVRRSPRLHGIPPDMELRPVVTDEAPQPEIKLHGSPEPQPAATDEAAQRDIDLYGPPEAELDTPQHDIESDSDDSPRFTKQEKGKAALRQ